MYTLLWLLLPIAAASGWYAAKRSAAQRNVSPRSLSRDYFQGLNFLVNDQPDKAIEALTRVLERDADTVETQIALGNLFRRRGEVDRAIRLHQSVTNQSHIEPEQRGEALLELGHDYIRAGLLDRAEMLLQELVDDPRRGEAALRHLLAVYQLEKEWDKCIAVAEKLQLRSGDKLGTSIAHFYCELAELARARRDSAKAAQSVAQALEADPRCVRASLLEGALARDGGNVQGAIAAFKRVGEQDPAYLCEAIRPMVDIHRELGRGAELGAYLDGLLRKHQCIDAALVAADLLRDQHGGADAAIYIANYLTRVPSLAALRRLVELTRNSSSGELKDTFRVIQTTLDRVLEKLPLYQCQQCGFKGRSLHWLCPGCKNWSTMKPVMAVCNEAA